MSKDILSNREDTVKISTTHCTINKSLAEVSINDLLENIRLLLNYIAKRRKNKYMKTLKLTKKKEKYPEYKDSGVEWLGEVPEGWKVTKNRSSLQRRRGEVNNKEDAPVLTLRIRGVEVKKDLNFGKSTESYIGHQLVYPGDIVFTPRDFDQTPILSGVAKDFGCISNLYFVLKTNIDTHNRFVNYFWWGLKHKVNFFKNFSSGMRHSFNYSQFKNLLFLKPSIDQQQKIADYLDQKTETIDKIIEKKKRLVALLEEKRASVINFTIQKQEGQAKKIKYIALINPSKSKITLNDDSDVSFVPMEKVTNKGEIDSESRKFGDVYSGYTYFENGDVLLAKITPCFENGKAAVAEIPERVGFGSSEFIVFRSNKNSIIPRYLYYVIYSNDFRELGKVEMTGTAGQKRLSDQFVRNYELNLPVIEEQQEVVEVLTKRSRGIDTAIEKTNQSIKLLQEYRASLISNVVTGKIKI